MISEKQVESMFRQGFDCGQVVLSSAAESLGIDIETAYRIAAGFGGGMFKGQTCGAVVGAIIALGIKYGHYQPDTSEKKNDMVAKTLEFQGKFTEIYPSTVCRELLGYDISNPEHMKIISEKGLLFNFCPKVAADASRILAEVL